MIRRFMFAVLAIAMVASRFAYGEQVASKDADGMTFDRAMEAWSFMVVKVGGPAHAKAANDRIT